jgi:hypothetical protein
MYQRLAKPTEIMKAFKVDCDYDLNTNSAWSVIREIMVHRHLYAHRSGLVDRGYIDSVRTVCGVDIEPDLVALGYPNEEVYWFEPLKRLSEYIEGARTFFREIDQ